ncbi:MAG: class II aldolase/adducin family protein, partial [Opitutaceae bacterium]
WIAVGLGSGFHRFGSDKLKDLIDLRQKLGMPDPRASLKECELCDDNSEFRVSAVCPVPPAEEPAEPQSTPEIEALVQKLTDEIMKQLNPGP